MAYEAINPEELRTSLAPLLGDGPAADVAASYMAMASLRDRSIEPELSAQKLLGVTSRTVGRWLIDIDLQ